MSSTSLPRRAHRDPIQESARTGPGQAVVAPDPDRRSVDCGLSTASAMSGNDAVTPAANLVTENPKVRGPSRSDRASGDNASLRTVWNHEREPVRS